jgi:DNA invertase Pin-like site-specific DNA recombinase
VLTQRSMKLVEVHGVAFYATSQGLASKPGGDATSMLILNILRSVSEFERAILRERTRLGLAEAKKHGTRSGRPIGRASTLPPDGAEKVKQLRATGKSWSEVTKEIGCSRGRRGRRSRRPNRQLALGPTLTTLTTTSLASQMTIVPRRAVTFLRASVSASAMVGNTAELA